MNAAKRIWLTGLRERVTLQIYRWWPIALVLAVVGVLAYAQGVSAGVAKEQARTVRVFAESSQVIEARIVARGAVAVKQANEATRQRIIYRDAAEHVRIVSDTVLRVDSVLVHVPMPVVREIIRCDSTVRADSLAFHVVAAQLDDMTHDRDTWRERALFDEQHQPKPSRVGFKSGVAAGVGVVAILVHFLR